MSETILYRCGPLLQAVIDLYGNESKQQALGESSGSVLEAQRPCQQWKWGSCKDNKALVDAASGLQLYGPATPAAAELEKRQKGESELIKECVQRNDELRAQGLDKDRRLARVEDWANGELRKLGIRRKVYMIDDNELTGVFNMGFTDPKGLTYDAWQQLVELGGV